MTRIPIHLAVLGLAIGLSSSALAQSNDRFTCYAIKDSAPRGRYQVTLSSAAGSQNCIVRTPAKIACVPSSQTAISPAAPESGPDGSATGGFLCYLAKCALPSSTANVEDQFGRRVVKFRATRFVCDPGDLSAAAPGSPTTTTTLPGSSDTCHFANGRCTGSCGTGKRCGTAVSSASCECRDVSCGDADAPACNGACTSPGEACVFNLSGCSCVNVP
jgi:hypothetical protein